MFLYFREQDLVVERRGVWPSRS